MLCIRKYNNKIPPIKDEQPGGICCARKPLHWWNLEHQKPPDKRKKRKLLLELRQWFLTNEN